MTDKERVLAHVIRGLYSTCLKYCPWQGEYDSPHFAPWIRGDNLKPGMLVLGQTGNMDKWLIAYLVRPLVEESLGGWLLKEIGSNKMCRMTNEGFIPILGVQPRYLYEQGQQSFYQKVLKAFKRGGEYMYRFGGLSFISEKKAKISIRQIFNGGPIGGTQPFSFEIEFDSKTSIKKILAQMKTRGYGTREFKKLSGVE